VQRRLEKLQQDHDRRFGVLVSGTTPAFVASAGYDLATGLGSVNVANLINKWSGPSLISTSVTLSPSTVSGTVGTSVTLSGSVTKSSGSGTPSGVVVFEDASSGTPAGKSSCREYSYRQRSEQPSDPQFQRGV